MVGKRQRTRGRRYRDEGELREAVRVECERAFLAAFGVPWSKVGALYGQDDEEGLAIE